MCKFEYGEDIRNPEDVRNLINGVIFRQEEPYTEQDILSQIDKYLVGSRVPISPSKRREMTESALSIFQLAGDLTLRNGVYTPREILASA